MEPATYNEWVPTGTFVKAAMLAVTSAIFLLLLALAIFIRPLNSEAFVGFGISIVTLLFILMLFYNFRGIRIQLDSTRLTVNYGVLNRKSIRIDDIASCKLVKASFKRFGGVGVRYGIDGSWAYSTSFGNAVQIVPKEGRTFVFSSNKPQRICKIINNKINSRKL